MPKPATSILLRDELVGFAKSRVMLVLWVVLPLLATLGFFLLPTLGGGNGSADAEIPLSYFMGLLLSSIAGTVAAIMIAVDIVSEKTRHVYELFVIRPVNPATILWAKFLAVFACVTVACVVSMSLGLVVDLVRGADQPPGAIADMLRSGVSLVSVIALSAAVGVLFGVLSKSILVAVILILYVGQNITIVPMLPTYLGLGEDLLWLATLASAVLTAGLMWLSGALFRRHEY